MQLIFHDKGTLYAILDVPNQRRNVLVSNPDLLNLPQSILVLSGS